MLRDAVRQACQGAGADITIVCRGDGAAATVMIRPAAPAGVFHDATALVLLVDDSVHAGPVTEVLAAMYRVTPRECDIASDILAGHRIDRIARKRRITTNTVRSHVKALFSKTGATNQAGLVRVLLASCPPVRPARLR